MNSGFGESDSNFNSLTVVDNGHVYFTLSSHQIDTHGRIYRYEPENQTLVFLADLGDLTGEQGKKTIPHGKSHSAFFSYQGKYYFATHYGYYQGNNNKEEPAPPPEGYHPYTGGKIFSYDEKSNAFTLLASAPAEEGIITMNMDTNKGLLYCLTWPKGYMMVYDINKNEMKNIGQVSRGGEIGAGDNYFCLCRIFAIDPRDNTAYFTNPDGTIYSYHPDEGVVKTVEWAHLKKDMFGVWDPHEGGHQGYNWRYLVWNEKHQKFFCVHGKSGYLFTFDPLKKELILLDRICSEYCRQNGCFEDFRYGYMTLTMQAGDDDTLYYISGYKKNDVSHLTAMTYHIPTRKLTDHGVITLENGKLPVNTQTLGIGKDGTWYTCPWIETGEKEPNGNPINDCQLITFTL